ncbi:MAG: ribose 5-phosphate isomerase B [Oscillospiraceae bacterium]|nr:ribose 5-phosphate isomerase B [Oscillospiraceae bacterium]
MIAIANDHAGLLLKPALIELLEERGIACRDLGVNTPESVDYPVYGKLAAKAVVSGECDRGIIICGTGIGISLAANKVPGARCVVASDAYSVRMSRMHNDTNMIAFGARALGPDLARLLLAVWLDTPFEGGRHQRRVDMLEEK